LQKRRGGPYTTKRRKVKTKKDLLGEERVNQVRRESLIQFKRGGEGGGRSIFKNNRKLREYRVITKRTGTSEGGEETKSEKGVRRKDPHSAKDSEVRIMSH